MNPIKVDTAVIKVGDMVRMLADDYNLSSIEQYPAGYTITLTPFGDKQTIRFTVLTNSNQSNHSRPSEG